MAGQIAQGKLGTPINSAINPVWTRNFSSEEFISSCYSYY